MGVEVNDLEPRLKEYMTGSVTAEDFLLDGLSFRLSPVPSGFCLSAGSG